MSTGAVRSVADQNRSAVDLVTAEIRRAVLTGALPPGEQFSIRELARQLGVSHIPIREALRRLEGQGLVILTQARSAAVAPLSEADVTAIYRLRLRIEPDLAGRSAGLPPRPGCVTSAMRWRRAGTRTPTGPGRGTIASTSCW